MIVNSAQRLLSNNFDILIIGIVAAASKQLLVLSKAQLFELSVAYISMWLTDRSNCWIPILDSLLAGQLIDNTDKFQSVSTGCNLTCPSA